jgi:hypothetical protein
MKLSVAKKIPFADLSKAQQDPETGNFCVLQKVSSELRKVQWERGGE